MARSKDAVMLMYVLRRSDTLQYFRQSMGPSWAKQGPWVDEIDRAKIYGNLRRAVSGARAAEGIPSRRMDGLLPVRPVVELVRLKVVEDGIESWRNGGRNENRKVDRDSPGVSESG